MGAKKRRVEFRRAFGLALLQFTLLFFAGKIGGNLWRAGDHLIAGAFVLAAVLAVWKWQRLW